MTAPNLVLVTCKQMQVELPKYRALLEDLGYEVEAPDLSGRQQFSAAELAVYGDRLVGIIAGDDELSASFFASSPHLRVLIRWGIGMDSVDHEAARAHGVSVRNTPGVFADEVADSALGYVLALARGHVRIDADVRAGGWPKHEGVTLSSKRMGVVGLGAIGRAIVRRAQAFGMEVVGHDPFLAEAPVPNLSVDELASTSDFVVLACPLTEQTYHLINETRLRGMRRDSYLVNVARGPVIDESALAVALSEGWIAGAGLDVFEVEPLPTESPLRSQPNVVFGSHNASNTREGVERASRVAVNSLIEGLSA